MSRFLRGRVREEVPSLGLLPGVGIDAASREGNVNQLVDGRSVPMLFQDGTKVVRIDGASPLLFLRILTA